MPGYLKAYAAAALDAYATFAGSAETPDVTPERAKRGGELYARHCAPCHGHSMKNPEVGIDLRKFPPEQHERFVQSVTKGKGAMPPWGGLLTPDDVVDLWSYVSIGENQ